MKEKTIKLYEYRELSPKAKEKALDDFRNNNFDSYGLQADLDNYLEELLTEYHIVPVADLKGYPSKYAKIYYSLSHSQGDGVMFEGVFEWKGQLITIKQSGRYYHSLSKDITWNDFVGEDKEAEEEKLAKEFEGIYQDICKKLEKAGYAGIEDMESEAYFIETCNANEWTFREDGTLEN
jgi:hypothetical protein